MEDSDGGSEGSQGTIGTLGSDGSDDSDGEVGRDDVDIAGVLGWEQAELVNMRALLLQEQLRLQEASAGITRNSAALAGAQVQRAMLLQQYQQRQQAMARRSVGAVGEAGGARGGY